MSLRKTLAAALSAATLITLAACGTSDETDTSAATEDTSAATFDPSTVKKDDELAAMLPESITKDGKLTVGAELTYAPAEFVGEDGKTAQGFDVDLTKALAALFGLEAETVSSSFDSIIPAVGSKYDLGISAFTINPERLDAVSMVSYGQAGMTYAVKTGNPGNFDTADLCGTKIAAQVGTVEEEAAKEAAAKCEADGKDKIEVMSFDQQTKAATAVTTGQADLFYADTPVTGYAIKQADGQLETLGENEDSAPLGIAVAKDDTQTLEAVQKAVQKLIDDGTYAKIFKAWGVEPAMIETAEINPAA